MVCADIPWINRPMSRHCHRKRGKCTGAKKRQKDSRAEKRKHTEELHAFEEMMFLIPTKNQLRVATGKNARFEN